MDGSGVRATVAPGSVAALADARFKRIALANPEHAPYGQAAKEALQAAGFAYAWEKVIRQEGIDAMIWHRFISLCSSGP